MRGSSQEPSKVLCQTPAVRFCHIVKVRTLPAAKVREVEEWEQMEKQGLKEQGQETTALTLTLKSQTNRDTFSHRGSYHEAQGGLCGMALCADLFYRRSVTFQVPLLVLLG